MKSTENSTLIYPNTLLIAIYAPYNLSNDIESYYEEFINLVKSKGIIYKDVIFMKLRSIDPGFFITEGKLNELIKICKEQEIEEIIISEPLTPQQEKSLSQILHCKVFDRTQLILEIFEENATSAEGKVQVELAMLQHQKSRLSGRGISMSQQGGRIGTKGPGETAKERAIQYIERRSLKIKRDLKNLEKQREIQRKKRLTSNVKQISLVGYTNAGKSTILNLLTHSNVLTQDKLFATLDTTTRELYIKNSKIGVISDTVGFIQLLPHNLIEAFKSTLSELFYSDLLLHVIDLSNKNWQSHINVVLQVLQEINVDKPMLYVFNKIDKIENIERYLELISKYQPHVLVNSLSKDSIKELIDYIYNWAK